MVIGLLIIIDHNEVKDVRVPENLQRAMAAEAEAARNARAKVMIINIIMIITINIIIITFMIMIINMVCRHIPTMTKSHDSGIIS